MRYLFFFIFFCTIQLEAFNKLNCFDIENLSNNEIQSCLLYNDKKLHEIYHNILQSYQGQVTNRQFLEETQTSWLSLSRKHCILLSQRAIENREVNRAICLLQKSQERIMNLKELLPRDENKDSLLIKIDSFKDIYVNDPIMAHTHHIDKNQLQTAEGTFLIYQIKDYNNHSVGYFFPDPNNQKLVGNIIITSPIAQTQKGIRIGDNFQKLRELIPNIRVHGSEIEGGTYASFNQLSYRLNLENFEYFLDINKIPLNSKIIEIIIQREAQ